MCPPEGTTWGMPGGDKPLPYHVHWQNGAIVNEIPSDPRKQTWEAGNYSTAAEQSIIVSELLCEAAHLRANENVLDVACGTGVTSLSAARRKADVAGIDFSGSSLAMARQRAAFERLDNVLFHEGNAEALPYQDESFDAVLSTFGVQFVGDQDRAAQEALRVCKPGGRIALANWTPAPFFGHFFKLMADYAPKQMKKTPTPEKPGVLWGTPDRLQELFGNRVEFDHLEEQVSRTRARSIDEWIKDTTGSLGPAVTILRQIDDEQGAAFVADLRALLEQYNTVPGPDVLLESPYLEVVMTKR